MIEVMATKQVGDDTIELCYDAEAMSYFTRIDNGTTKRCSNFKDGEAQFQRVVKSAVKYHSGYFDADN